MDVVRSVLAARPDASAPSPAVAHLLECLDDTHFGLDVCVCSVGGVGSTELCNALSRCGLRCNLLTDQDGLRHAPRPPRSLGTHTTVIYLLGDPLSSVASHYRRGHAQHQALKTSGRAELAHDAAFPKDLQQYLDRAEDLFGLEAHITAWLTTPTPYDVLCCRYEDMFKPEVARVLFHHVCNRHAASVAPALALDADALAERFASGQRPRASRVDDAQRGRMYVQLTARVQGLPPVFLRTHDCRIVPLLPGGVVLG
jgi:hypothetical protein